MHLALFQGMEPALLAEGAALAARNLFGNDVQNT